MCKGYNKYMFLCKVYNARMVKNILEKKGTVPYLIVLEKIIKMGEKRDHACFKNRY